MDWGKRQHCKAFSDSENTGQACGVPARVGGFVIDLSNPPASAGGFAWCSRLVPFPTLTVTCLFPLLEIFENQIFSTGNPAKSTFRFQSLKMSKLYYVSLLLRKILFSGILSEIGNY